MKCPKCQFENLEEAAFCRKCGNKLEILCPECGRMIPPDSVFCQKCGHDLGTPGEAPPIDHSQPQSYTPKFLADKILKTRSSMEGERKLVTVLFADVANYTSLSEKLDPEEAHQIMDGCFKILMDEIHRCEGTINQFTGDGVMALFGAPVAHEDHARQACYAALSIQKAVEEYGEKIRKDLGLEFKLRIGLNSGPVIVGSIGDDLRMDYTAVGDTTNLAFRMQSMARPGATLVSGHAHKLARDFFQFESLGKLLVKGKEDPQEAYQLIRASKVETRIEASVVKGLTKFVGRQKKIEALKEAFEMARSGSGQVAGIVGEAGVGKSRLLLEVRGMLPEGEHTYLEGRCLHYGGSMPYLPILDILKSYFDIQEGEREFLIKKKVRERIAHLDKKLLSTLPSFQELLSLTVDDDKHLQVDAQQRRERNFAAIRDLLIRESQARPLVIVVEDLHWIDKTSEEFLDSLIGGLAHHPILLVILYRPEYSHYWGSKSYYSQIGIDQLSTGTSTELVQSLLEEGEVVPELRELILGRAGGNPLFVEELTHSLLENGSIKKEDSQYVLSQRASDIQVPDTIQGIIAARIDRVEDNLKRIMQVASVIGTEFAYRILQTIMGMREELKSHLLNLQGLEFIYEKQLFPELEYIFKHALTQEVAYNSLLLKRRKEIHEKIGKAIEGIYAEKLEEYYELLAYHYVRSENKDKAVDYLALASQKAAKTNVIEEAMACFEQAMELLDALPDTEENGQRRISLLVNQWIVFGLLFRIQDYYDLMIQYEPVVARIDNPGLKGAFYVNFGNCDCTFGNFDKAIETLTRAAEICETSGKDEEAGLAYVVLEFCHNSKGNYDQAFAFKEKALLKMDEHFNLRWFVYALCWASWSLNVLGRFDEAEKEAQRALTVAQEYSDNGMISHASYFISLVSSSKGDLDRALEYGKLAYERAPTPMDKASAQYALATAWTWAGREPSKAIKLLEPFVQMAREGHFVLGELLGLGRLTEAYFLANKYDQAKQTAEDFLELAYRCGARPECGFAHLLLGEIALETNLEQAVPHFEQSISICRELKAGSSLGRAYAGYGRLHKRQGRIPEARQYLTQALEIFERIGHLIEPGKVRKELAELPEKPAGQGKGRKVKRKKKQDSFV